MVTFMCYNCDKTLKKQQVDKHSYMCRKPLRLICIDCKKQFHGDEHVGHTSCLSEKQMTWGQFADKKPNQPAKPTVQQNGNGKHEVKASQGFIGWRKSIQKALKQESKQQIKLDKIQKIVVDEYLSFQPDVEREEAELLFQQKVNEGKSYEIINIPYIMFKKAQE